MDEKFISILQGAGDIFMRFGIKSVTMDDIARELKTSKKTLYKYVRDKNELVKKVMEAHCQVERMQCTQILENSENAIDEILVITKHVSNQVKQVHPSIHYDLEKYYTEAWQIFNEHKHVFIYECVLKNLKRGVKEGYYRESLNAPIIAKIYIQKIDVVFDPLIFPPSEYRFEEVHMEMFRYHIRGIASRKGIEYLKSKIKKEQINFL